MTSWDYYVGFEREPEGLEAFLKSQGYDPTPIETDNDSDRNYESGEGGLVDLFYFSKSPEVNGGEEPDWKGAGFNIASELMISTKNSAASESAERLSEEIARRYNAVIYDSQGEEYFRSDEL